MKPRPPTGAPCPADPTHGALLEIDGRLWCPHQSHDAARIRPAAPRDTAPAPIAAPVAPTGPTEPAPRRTVVDYTKLAPAGFRIVAPGAEPERPERPEPLTLWS